MNDGFARRPVEGLIRNAAIEDVRQAMAEAFPPDDILPITFTGLVLRQGDRLTVIDTGNGEFGGPTSGNWLKNFRAAGFDPAAVTSVVISHFHGDHINGLRAKDGTATFPKAEVMVPEAEWAFWMDDARMSQAPEGMKGAFQSRSPGLRTGGGRREALRLGQGDRSRVSRASTPPGIRLVTRPSCSRPRAAG